ncbi:DUF5060 domain-containing protein [Arenicella xantha]|uniref:Collagenase-like protein with putative collagen-binding domain n=1 Tax=Arenicella xantha TaxID=644221 RepID=A0A395JJI5_9GAMM|nr:DUF5060 domain-containing protein [Arenicella xantha]RBP49919.1 collagenase-like protein with putative collagen-binding domain [Arenicella xantha]
MFRPLSTKLFLVSVLLNCNLFAAPLALSQTPNKVIAPILLLMDDEVTATGPVRLSGEQRVWHTLTFDVIGPQASETGSPNPFTDYRLDVVFTQGAQEFVVPGFFAADGNASETSATSGAIWRTRFTPNKTGVWSYRYQFTQGNDVAINGGGTPVADLHGVTGRFNVSASNKSGRDFRGKGRLEYVGKRYLRHAGTQEYFVKVGADAPEGLLGYADFDGTLNQNGTDAGIKSFSKHVNDWQAGDPSWQGGLGKGLIGALNYLASEEQNAFSFLTYSVGGDSKTVWPFIAATDRLRYDVSKLAQWERVFSHADQLGLYLHFKLQETENDNGSSGLDGGDMGPERSLYFRELIARFGHHLALNWNLGEENTQTTEQRRAMAEYFYLNDPYHNHIVIHTYPNQQADVYPPLLGSLSRITGASVQTSYSNVHRDTLRWINESRDADANNVWVVANDEQGSANIGVPPDNGYQDSPESTPYAGTSVSQGDIRHETLWGNLMAGGAGVEYYFGYQQPCNDLNCEDYRSRDAMWDYNRYALQFFKNHLPFADMQSRDDLIDNADNSDNDGYCLAKLGEVYAIYLPDDKRVSLDLTNQTGTYEVRWYNPRSGGALMTGSISNINGGASRALGNPPVSSTDDEDDWVVLVKRT